MNHILDEDSRYTNNTMKKTLRFILSAVVAMALVACTETPETLVRDGYDQTEMDKAIARAQSEVDAFIVVFQSGEADSFSVKAPITQGDDIEHFWITDISYEGGYFTGKIGNDPGVVTNVTFGQEWKVKKNEISDWMYTRGPMIHGGYTIDPLLSTMSADEAAALKASLVR